MIAPASLRRRVALVASSLLVAAPLGGCIMPAPVPPTAPTAPSGPSGPPDPTDLDLELLALEHHDVWGDALVATVDAAADGVETMANVDPLATREAAMPEVSTLLALLGSGQRLVAYADAVDATVRSRALPAFEVLLCVDPTTLRYDDLEGSPMDLEFDGPWPMVVGYEHRDDELPLMTSVALDPALSDSCG